MFLLWQRKLFPRSLTMALDLCTEDCRFRRNRQADDLKIGSGRGEQNSQENDSPAVDKIVLDV